MKSVTAVSDDQTPPDPPFPWDRLNEGLHGRAGAREPSCERLGVWGGLWSQRVSLIGLVNPLEAHRRVQDARNLHSRLLTLPCATAAG